jgi:MoaA/NifB/PqqE/SkfB family radical SAM enzyme
MNLFRQLYRYTCSKMNLTPFFCHLNITSHCDLKCKHCSVPEDFRRIDKEGKGDMSFEQIELAAENLKKLGVSNILLTGGEPFSRKDLVEIVRLLVRKGFMVRIATNGASLVTEERMLEVFNAGLYSLQVSFDSMRPELYDEITCKEGTWLQAKNTLEFAAKHLKKGMSIALVVVSNLNLDELPEIARYITSIGAYCVFQPVCVWPKLENKYGSVDIQDYNAMNIPESQNDKIESIYNELLLMKKKGYHILASERYLKESLKYFLNRKTQWTCDAYKYYLTVCPNGEILPCHRYEDLDWMNRINVLDTNFCEEFNSAKMKKQSEGFRNRCPGCALACYHEMSSFFNDPATFFDMSFQVARKSLRSLFRRT